MLVSIVAFVVVDDDVGDDDDSDDNDAADDDDNYLLILFSQRWLFNCSYSLLLWLAPSFPRTQPHALLI